MEMFSGCCSSGLHFNSQAATEQKYSGGSKVCCFGSQRQKGKHTQSFPSLFVTVRLLRLNNSVRPCSVLLLPLSLWFSSASVTCAGYDFVLVHYIKRRKHKILCRREGAHDVHWWGENRVTFSTVSITLLMIQICLWSGEWLTECSSVSSNVFNLAKFPIKQMTHTFCVGMNPPTHLAE